MKNGRFLAIFLLAATGFRWWWNFPRPLSPDEAYLALCGSIPSLAYFEGPGGVQWLVSLGIAIAGPGGFGAAFFWPLFAAFTSVALYLLTSFLGKKHEALVITVLLNLLPVFNQASLHPTCAMPLALTALGTSLCAWLALEKHSAAGWAAAGLCTAIGLLFCYSAWIFLPAITIVLLASHRWRGRLATPGFWLAWLAPVVVYALLLRWNKLHGWIHFIGETWRTTLTLHGSLFPPAVLSAVEAVSPLAFFVLCAAWGAALQNIHASSKIKFLAVPAFMALLATTYAALRGTSISAAGLAALALMLPLMTWLPTRIGRTPLRTALTIVILTAALWTAGTLPHPDSRAFINSDVGRKIEGLQATHSNLALFLVAEDAPTASALALALPRQIPAAPGHPPVYTLESADARSQFDLWPRYDQFVEAPQASQTTQADPFTEQDGSNPFLGRSALYLTTEKPDELPQAVTAAFMAVEIIGEIPTPDGHVLRVYLCSDYQTMPL